MSNNYQAEFQHWIDREKCALTLMNLVGNLWFERSVELVLFRKPLFDIGSSEVLAHHQYATEVSGRSVSVFETTELAQALHASNLAPSRIDLGRLCLEWQDEHDRFATVRDFIASKLRDYIGREKRALVPKDVVLFGFGRIGRIAARELIKQTGKGEQLRLRAIVTRSCSDKELIKRAELFKTDSVHGPFQGTVKVDTARQALIINGQTVFFIAARTPEEVDYTGFGISNALLIDNTGVFRDRAALSRHLEAKGIDQVLLTAPAKDDVPNIVCGINDTAYPAAESVFSCASCTTNAIVPVLHLVNEFIGIRKAHIETVHAYTNDQNLLDNYHPKYRRGRSAALNLVITETGADKAVARVLPQLAGKLTGNAVRVPTPNGSLAILNLSLAKAVNRHEIEQLLRNASLFGALCEQVEYSLSTEVVSTDMIGNSHAAVIDGPATILSADGKSLILYVWYDNEYGYTRQVIRLAKKLAGVVRLTYY